MANKKSGNTALGVSITRVIEQYQPPQQRLFTDSVAKYLTPAPAEFLLHFKVFRKWMTGLFDLKAKGIYGLLVCRTKFIDEQLKLAINSGIKQVIILGAGMDTRPYRIDGISNTKVFEVDMPWVQNLKKKMVQKKFKLLPSYITYVPIDFNSESLKEVLQQNKLDFSKPAVVVCEGVTQYITKEAVEAIFSFCSALCTGSRVIFTYVLESVITRTSTVQGANELMEYSKKKNWDWIFGFDTNKLPAFLINYGFTLTEDVGNSFYQQNYLQPIKRVLTVSEVERVAVAWK